MDECIFEIDETTGIAFVAEDDCNDNPFAISKELADEIYSLHGIIYTDIDLSRNYRKQEDWG